MYLFPLMKPPLWLRGRFIALRVPPRGKSDGVIGHVSERENGNWMKTIALLHDKSIWHPSWLGELGVNMNFRQFLGVICAKNQRESGISSPPWGPPSERLFDMLILSDDKMVKLENLLYCGNLWVYLMLELPNNRKTSGIINNFIKY